MLYNLPLSNEARNATDKNHAQTTPLQIGLKELSLDRVAS